MVFKEHVILKKHITKASGWLIFTALLAADRVSKVLAAYYLRETSIAEGALLSLSLHRNYGISFSLLENFPLASLSISILGIALFGLLCLKNESLRHSRGVIFLWAGAIGNLADRLLYGYVIDWLRIETFGLFGLFGLYINLADIWLVVGGFNVFYGLTVTRRPGDVF